METKRLVLRPFQIEDAKQLYELAKDINVGTNAGWPPHKSVEESRKIIETVFCQDDQYAIFLKETNELIGAVGLSPDTKRLNPCIKSLGYWIGQKFWGNGYATEASKRVLIYAFEEKKLNGVSVVHFSINEKSKNVISKLGFVYEGTLRYASRRYDGVELDDVEYLMDKEQYEKVKDDLWRE